MMNLAYIQQEIAHNTLCVFSQYQLNKKKRFRQSKSSSIKTNSQTALLVLITKFSLLSDTQTIDFHNLSYFKCLVRLTDSTENVSLHSHSSVSPPGFEIS